jgi:hypothetical protein
MSRRRVTAAAGCAQTQRHAAKAPRRGAEARAPQGCKCMIAIDARLLRSGKPDPDDAYWN